MEVGKHVASGFAFDYIFLNSRAAPCSPLATPLEVGIIHVLSFIIQYYLIKKYYIIYGIIEYVAVVFGF